MKSQTLLILHIEWILLIRVPMMQNANPFVIKENSIRFEVVRANKISSQKLQNMRYLHVIIRLKKTHNRIWHYFCAKTNCQFQNCYFATALFHIFLCAYKIHKSWIYRYDIRYAHV